MVSCICLGWPSTAASCLLSVAPFPSPVSQSEPLPEESHSPSSRVFVLMSPSGQTSLPVCVCTSTPLIQPPDLPPVDALRLRTI